MKDIKKWTLNADVGEGCDDGLIMPYLDCANIACGAHAGSEAVMNNTLALAKKNHVIMGAHPGYPDKKNFGRFSLDMSADDLVKTLDRQMRLLMNLAKASGAKIEYVKPHGALNHDMLQRTDVMTTICRVVAEIDSDLVLMIPTNAKQEVQQVLAEEYGLSIWWEVFADRAYEPNGLLRPRKYDDAVHAEPQTIIDQLKRIYYHGEVVAIDGSVLDVSVAQSICIHGDHKPSVTAIQSWARPV